MSKIIMKGRTVEEAIDSALQVLKIPRELAKIRIIDEGEPAVLGVFGGKEASVEVKAKRDTAEEAKNVLQDILDKMMLLTNVYINDIKDSSVYLEIKGDDIPIIIGKEGQTLDAIQYLTNIIANIGNEERQHIIVDSGGYRQKQDKRIEKAAKEAAEEVLSTGNELIMLPMNARERRIVHMVIKDYSKLRTESRGEKADRCVVVMPI